MAQEEKTVETKTESAVAPQTGVETTTSPAPSDDPMAKLESLLEENKKLARDRDNYRDGLLAMKGKKEVDELDLTDPIQLQSYIDKKLEEKLLAAKEEQSTAELESFARELARKNKELATAVVNKTQTPVGGSTGEGGMETKTSYFSPEQVNELKKRWASQGIKSERYDEMLKKAETLARQQ